MASSEDGDLIDLANDTCVPRVTVLDDATIEEQEHLLDVCPPKLEQTLFLSKKQENRLQESENGDVLVTLGHDQVVPIRKRIDVVSSDTIKRIRDITKNLEPVITIRRASSFESNEEIERNGADTVDFSESPKTDPKRSVSNGFVEDSFEAREISNAFDFLSEHEPEHEHEEDPRNRLEDVSTSSSFHFLVTEDESRFPFESSSRTFERDSTSNHEANRGGGGGVGIIVTQEERCVPLEDSAGFESSRRSEESSSCCDPWTCRIVEDSVLESRRRSLRRHQRKSWTEGTTGYDGSTPTLLLNANGYGSLDASTSSDVSPRRKDFFGPSSPTSGSSVCGSDDGCSESSEVDWSWLEEVECSRSSSMPKAAGVESCERAVGGGNEDVERLRSCDSHRSAAMTVGAAGKSPEHVSPLFSPANPTNSTTTPPTSLTNQSEQFEGNHESESSNVEQSTRDVSNGVSTTTATSTSTTTSTTSSWMRASMRRLRHFRLPENAERQRADHENDRRATALVAAPNSLPDIALIAPEILAAQTNGTSGVQLRPSSAPAVRNSGTNCVATVRRVGRHCAPQPQQLQSQSRAGRNREVASRHEVQVSGSTSVSGNTRSSSLRNASSTTSTSSTATSPARNISRRVCERQRNDVDRDDDRGEDDDEDENPLGKWPHAVSSTLACLGCTLGLFNISRFAILSVQFGANFIVQFLILSFVLGIPLFTLQVCLGQRLTAGSVDMWRISPLFQGVGVALLAAHTLIGIYSIVGVSWMFVYFRDSFVTKQDKYRWAEPLVLYGPTHNSSSSYRLQETVPDYFNDAVLRRQRLSETDPGSITLKFQVAFNLAVVWMIVFVSLSKGLRSYGKVVYVFTLVPVFGTLILCTKLLGLTPPGSLHQLFPATVWTEFFINGKSWVAASNEVFLTWGLLGAAAMQIAAHNKHKHLLQRDTSFVIVLTFVVLLLAALLANTCVQILRDHGYVYTTSSFERPSVYTFLRPISQPAPPGYASSTPERFMTHTSFIVGERVIRPGVDLSSESGYQVLRLSTELVPATLAVLGTEQVSPFWAVLFYFILILFGISQQLAIWHCVITGITAINSKLMKMWKTTLTFFSCACAYILGLPMATELGIYVVYYLDYTVGGAWWIMVLYLIQVGAVFAVRGRPHSGEAVVAELFPPTGRYLRHWAGPLLSFTWNVILPVILMVLCITVFKNGGFRELYAYRRTSRDYWAIWARQLGASIQLIPILTIPAIAIVQTCRYLNNGPPDILDRIQMLYRPPLETDDPRDVQTQIGTDVSSSIHGNGILPTTTDVPFEDPPPKYTPPPSYTTATGARIAKMLRQSFRRSVRRIANVLGESSVPRQRPALQPPPPDYATVLVEMNQSARSNDTSIHVNVDLTRNDVPNGGRDNQRNEIVDGVRRSSTIDRSMRINTVDRCTIERAHSTLDSGRRSNSNSNSLNANNLTAADVANLLRSSIRRGTAHTQQTLRRSFCHEENRVAASVENLVEAAAPIGQDSLVLPKDVSLVSHDEQDNIDDNSEEKKTADEMENSISVI